MKKLMILKKIAMRILSKDIKKYENIILNLNKKNTELFCAKRDVEKENTILKKDIEILKRESAQEVPVQEQKSNSYPTNLNFEVPLPLISDNRTLHDGNFINLSLTISSSMYKKEDILREIKIICQQLLKCFH